jgi:hypothetical protein
VWVLAPLYLASAILKGFAPHGSNMLGDTLPWFLPLFVFGLFAWIFYEAIEKYAKKKNTSFWLGAILAIRWLPPVQLLLMLIVRLIALIQRDLTHIEIAQYMGPGDFSLSDLKLIMTGDGGFESVVLVILLFALLSERLPSIANARSDLRQDFRNRMMMFTGLVLLLFSTTLFPETSYYSANTLPLNPIGTIPSWDTLAPVLLFTGLTMFGGELFAVSTLFFAGENFQTLARRARNKVLILALTTIVWLSLTLDIQDGWLQKVPEIGLLLPLTLMLHLGVCLAIVIQPAVRIESELNHGEGRSWAMMILAATMALFVLVLTPFHLDEIGVFGTGLGPYVYGFWVAAVAVSVMMLVQFLPALGFDAAPRPEIWWMKMTLVFSPIILCMFTPFALFLIPAIWLALPWSSLTPWFIERDVPSPSASFVLYPVLFITAMCAILPFSSDEPFLTSLWFGWIPGAMATIGLTLHIKHNDKESGNNSEDE